MAGPISGVPGLMMMQASIAGSAAEAADQTTALKSESTRTRMRTTSSSSSSSLCVSAASSPYSTREEETASKPLPLRPTYTSNSRVRSQPTTGTKPAGGSLKWNTLPKIGETLYERKHSMNVTWTDSMHIVYDPRYNPKLNKFDAFIQFNEQCPLSDVVTMASARYHSFVKFLNYYHESKKFMQYDKETHWDAMNYPGEIDGINFHEIDYLVQLWYLQCLRFIHKTQSLIFSPNVVKWLLQRRQNIHHYQQHQSVDGSKGIVDPDILLIRAGIADSFWGWQVAYDEPNLNVVDFVLDVSPFTKSGQNKAMQSPAVDRVTVKDAMGRSAEELELLLSPVGSLSSHGNDSDVGLNVSPQKNLVAGKSNTNSTAPNKLMKAAHAGTSGIAHLFKKKNSNNNMDIVSSTLENLHLGNDGRDSLHSDTTTLTLKNKWLENHYSKRLSNFSSIHTPPTFEVPSSVDETDLENEKMMDYKLQYLKINLPFKDHSIPSIICPSLWFHLRFDKWKVVLQELYRCLVPGGSLQTEVFDFKGSNIDIDNNCLNSTTSELKKILDATALEAMKENIQIYPMRHLVSLLNKVGFVNVKCCVLSLKRGDLVNDLGFVYEFMAMFHYDGLIRQYLNDSSKYPEGTNPLTFPIRYYGEHMGKIDEHVGCLRMVSITAEKPLR